MRKIFLILSILYLFSAISFASPHENGIDDFYFGQPIEEIQQQYELSNEEYDEEEGITKYEVQVPSLNFYDMKIDQPITLEFKNNNLCGISFTSITTTPAETTELYKNVVSFASVQYGKPLGNDFMATWFTGKIFLGIANIDLTEALSSINSNNKNTAYVSVYMYEKYMGENELKVFKQMVASQK